MDSVLRQVPFALFDEEVGESAPEAEVIGVAADGKYATLGFIYCR